MWAGDLGAGAMQWYQYNDDDTSTATHDTANASANTQANHSSASYIAAHNECSDYSAAAAN